MHLSLLLIALAAVSNAASNGDALPRSATVYVWPLTSPSPTPLATVAYNPHTLEASTKKYTPPKIAQAAAGSSDDDDDGQLTRVGLYSPSTKKWSGVLTDASAFKTDLQRTLALHLDRKGEVWHVGFHASSAPASTGQEEVQVRLMTATPGPNPFVNKPMLVDSEGKQPEEVVEKTLFQK